jgi:lipopolysaccharide transport system ATP-binding protein
VVLFGSKRLESGLQMFSKGSLVSNELAIGVEGLSKCYQIYEKPSDRLKQAVYPYVKRAFGRDTGQYFREFWALRDVSFEVGKGETVGIIGRNGSGKSTLLQMICGTLQPTTGTVQTHGRVAALLELGAGFNPEFTGRENVFMNATILGLTYEQTTAKFDDIAAFADIGEFIDQPVKHYSSGMYARLAFAVAINVDPDILVVDEALSVGDEPFQRKCFARIEKIRNEGATILFVSHSGGTIINLCSRAILLHRGKRLFTGLPKRAVFFSQKLGNTSETDNFEVLQEIESADSESKGSKFLHNQASVPVDITPLPKKNEEISTDLKEFFDTNLISKSIHSYKENGACIQSPCLKTPEDMSVNHVFRGEQYYLQCEVRFDRDCYGVRIYALIRTTAGVDLAGCVYPQFIEEPLNVVAGSNYKFEFQFDCLLNPATYFCNFAVQGADGLLLHRLVDALAFRVLEKGPSPATGLVDIGFRPRMYQVSPKDNKK